jgi:hypothetical protein
MPPVALRCTSIIKKGRAFACPTGWTMGAFTPCSNWRAPHRRISQGPRDRWRAFRELRLRLSFSASRRTDGETGRKAVSNDAGSLPSPTAAIWTRHFSPGPMTRSSPNGDRHRRRSANRHHKSGGPWPQRCAHRYSGSEWHSLSARNDPRMGAWLERCRMSGRKFESVADGTRQRVMLRVGTTTTGRAGTSTLERRIQCSR